MTTCRAALPMYDLPEVREATDAWWVALARACRRAGIECVPERLDRDRDREAVWRDPDLLLAQTCGYPLTHDFRDWLRPVAAPVYRAEGCTGALYRSAFVVRADDPARTLADLRGRQAAVNDPESQSGCNCLRAAVAPLAMGARFFAGVILSGAHRSSLALVVEGRADLAAIDAVTYALLRRHAPTETAAVRVLTWSAPAPALPYATRRAAGPELIERLREALSEAAADPRAKAARETLLLDGFLPVETDDYATVAAMRRDAEARGYPELA